MESQSLQDATRARIVALHHRLVRIQTQCIVTRDSIDIQVQRCSILEDSIRTIHAFKDDPEFVVWRSLVSTMWHRLRRELDWPEERGLKYLSRETRDLEARLKRQCVCVEWGMPERVFLCSCAMADSEDTFWETLLHQRGSGRMDGRRNTKEVVPDFGCAVVAETMEFALEKIGVNEGVPIVAIELVKDDKEEGLKQNERILSGVLKDDEEIPSGLSIPPLTTETRIEAEFSSCHAAPFDSRHVPRMDRRSSVTSRIPRITYRRDPSPLPPMPSLKRQSVSIVHIGHSKIPIVPTLQRKRRASVAAIPLTPPSPTDSRKGVASAFKEATAAFKHATSAFKDAEKRAKLRRSFIPKVKTMAKNATDC